MSRLSAEYRKTDAGNEINTFNNYTEMKAFCLILILFSSLVTALAQAPKMYCNPLDISYGLANDRRHAADPVIVLFKDKYYLFTTNDLSGYRVSDDLLNWKEVLFDAASAPLALNGKLTCAPAAATDGNYLYFIKHNLDKTPRTAILRTRDPESGVWEKCGEIRNVKDPCLYIENGRYYLYHGLGADYPIQFFELDPVTFTEIPGSSVLLKSKVTSLDGLVGGFERGRRELWEDIDPAKWLGKFNILPCPEAAWMTKHDNKYYLQYGTPGTVSTWYCDVAMVGDSPAGPFKMVDYNPVSMKIGGFVGSAGHSCVFQDKYENWWRVSTMWIGVKDAFERRIGLFPVVFDKDGRMLTITKWGDYPHYMPQKKWSATDLFRPEWQLISKGAKCYSSSSIPGHSPDLASDENIRTWWSAVSGNAGEWLMMDLGAIYPLNAVQLNFAEEGTSQTIDRQDDYYHWTLYGSADSVNWTVIKDNSSDKSARPHQLIVLDEPANYKYLKLKNLYVSSGGKFAVRDLRVFGTTTGKIPSQVADFEFVRDPDDSRNGKIMWNGVENTEGYIVNFGTSPGVLNNFIQISDPGKTDLSLHVLMKDIPYFFRIDTWNKSGVSIGKIH
jgi:xylan 1,4-beta-xylosidase